MLITIKKWLAWIFAIFTIIPIYGVLAMIKSICSFLMKKIKDFDIKYLEKYL